MAVPSDEDIRALAARILERPEYAGWHQRRSAVRSVLDWFFTLWERDPVMYWIILGSLLVVTLLLLVHVGWSIRVALAAPAPPDARGSRDESPRFLDEADALARSGRFLEAARRVQLAVIALLLGSRLIELTRSDTNRTLRERLRDAGLAHPGRRELLGELTVLVDRLERTWFRDRGEDASLYAAWRALHARLAAGPEMA